MNNTPLSVTPKALERIHHLLKQREKPSLGIRVSIRTKGCSGLSYSIEYVDQKNDSDEVIEYGEISFFIDPKALIFILGTEMDFLEDKMSSGFVFRNPNEKGRCGCGKSFRV